jgi:hypothetical protein
MRFTALRAMGLKNGISRRFGSSPSDSGRCDLYGSPVTLVRCSALVRLRLPAANATLVSNRHGGRTWTFKNGRLGIESNFGN